MVVCGGCNVQCAMCNVMGEGMGEGMGGRCIPVIYLND